MRVNCSLCSIWNRANVFYQVFTSKKHTPPVVCTQCCAWEGCSQCLLQLGTQREQIPVAARVGAQQEPGASAWHFQKLCFVTAETKHSSHLPVSPAANSESCHTGKNIYFSVSLLPPDTFSHYLVPCAEREVEGCNPKPPSLRAAL